MVPPMSPYQQMKKSTICYVKPLSRFRLKSLIGGASWEHIIWILWVSFNYIHWYRRSNRQDLGSSISPYSQMKNLCFAMWHPKLILIKIYNRRSHWEHVIKIMWKSHWSRRCDGKKEWKNDRRKDRQTPRYL